MIDLHALTAAVGALDEETMMRSLKEFVSSKPSSEDAQTVINACQRGMEIIGDLFEEHVYYVADLIYAGELLTQAVDELKPILGSGTLGTAGKIVLGTVEGDLHDIGKNIFKSMAEASGFLVYDLGIDQKPSAFVEKVKEVSPDIVGMSGVLTLALDSMKNTMDAIEAAGLRQKVKVTIGGACVSEDARDHIGADFQSKNAAESVKVCLGWVSRRDS